MKYLTTPIILVSLLLLIANCSNPPPNSRPPNKEVVIKQFEEYDEDMNEVLTKRELITLLKDKHEEHIVPQKEMTRQQSEIRFVNGMMRFINEYDLDNNGVDIEEYYAFMKGDEIKKDKEQESQSESL